MSCLTVRCPLLQIASSIMRYVLSHVVAVVNSAWCCCCCCFRPQPSPKSQLTIIQLLQDFPQVFFSSVLLPKCLIFFYLFFLFSFCQNFAMQLAESLSISFFVQKTACIGEILRTKLLPLKARVIIFSERCIQVRHT